METELRVLLALSDKNLTLQIIEKFKNKFPNCPLIFDSVDDGARAINEVRLFKPAVVVMNYILPTVSGHDLVMEILKVFSECEIIVLANENEEVDVGLIKMHLPIYDWDLLIRQMTQCLPMDFQIQYSLTSRNEALHLELKELTKKYKQDQDQAKTKTMSWIYLNETTPTLNVISEPNRSLQSIQEQSKNAGKDLSRFVWAELFVLGITAASLIAVSHFAEDGGFLKAGIQTSLTALLIFNGLGFFFLRLNSRAQKK
jgi:hypothetical protein